MNRFLAALLALALSMPLALASDINSSDWSQTDANNNVASPKGFPENMAPSGVNDSARAVMGAVKRWHDQVGVTVTSGGSANAQTLTYSVAPSALVVGDVFCFKAGFTNTAATTLNVGVGGALSVVQSGAAPTSLNGGEIRQDYTSCVWYDGTRYELMGDEASLVGFTPTDASGASLTFTGSCAYWKTREWVKIRCQITFPTTASTANAALTMPFAAIAHSYITVPFPVRAGTASAVFVNISSGSATANFVNFSGTAFRNVDLSTLTLTFGLDYPY